MLVPSLFTDNFVNDFFNDAFDRTPAMFKASGSTMMSADIKEYKDHYELGLELPGYKKEDVTASLKDGYLTIEAKRETDSNAGDDGGRYIRRERFVGTLTRSFYVGEDVKQEDIKARFDNGVLDINVPKVQYVPEVETARNITIE
ncbi:MAG: Hsp20/alpha crystallin family protein [Lachnospiraceae bacterium]|nr:Hsp20/alpha crystallin family protein [Lachnospiraceae bacterium]